MNLVSVFIIRMNLKKIRDQIDQFTNTTTKRDYGSTFTIAILETTVIEPTIAVIRNHSRRSNLRTYGGGYYNHCRRHNLP